MEAIQVSDLPEDPYRKQLAQKAANIYIDNIPLPWKNDVWKPDMSDLAYPNFRFAKMVLGVLREEEATLSSREQLRLFLWEAFTAYKLMPFEEINQGSELAKTYEPFTLVFPLRELHEWKQGTVQEETRGSLSHSDIFAKVEFLTQGIENLLNRRFILLETLWKEKSTKADVKHSQEFGELMKNLEQHRNVLWSFCTVSGYAYPDEDAIDTPRTPLTREFDPSPAESFLLRYMPKQFMEVERSLFVFQTTGVDSPEERKALYEKLLERKLLLWYWISKNKILKNYYSDECTQHYTVLIDEINGCFLKIKIVPSVEKDPTIETKPFIPPFQHVLINLINMVFSLESKQESLWFMELMSGAIGILHAYLEGVLAIRKQHWCNTFEYINELNKLKLLTRRNLKDKIEQIEKLYESWEKPHDVYKHAERALSMLHEIQF